MLKEIRRAFHDSGAAIKNFFYWVPQATKHVIDETPSSLGHFKSWALSFRGGITFVSLIGLILIPLITQNNYYTTLLIYAMIYAILAASWDFLAGIAGQVSFGHAAFLGIAGFTTAILISSYNCPPLLALLIGAITAMLFGLLIGIPCLRLKGPYLALGTLAFSIILFRLFMSSGWPIKQISGLPKLSSQINIFFIILGFMLLTFAFLHIITSSRAGKILKSIRDDEICAEASGINTTKYKLLAFAVSAFVAGIAGALMVMVNTTAEYGLFDSQYSFYAIVMACIGGIGTISGAIIGALLFQIISLISGYLPFLGEAQLLILPIVLLIVILAAEMGVLNPLIDNLKKLYDLLRRR